MHILDATQITTRHTMSVTGHKAETSLKTYTGHIYNKTKKPMSNIITKSTGAVSDINKSSEQAKNAHKDIADFTLEPVTKNQYDDLMDDLNSDPDRLLAKWSYPPPLGNFADIPYLKEQSFLHRIRDVCTLYIGA